MSEVSQAELKHAVESQHGGTATFVQSVPVKEIFRGQAAYPGNGAIFDLKGSPSGAHPRLTMAHSPKHAKQ